MTQCLFIGGPAAGKMIEVDTDRQSIQMPVIPAIPIIPAYFRGETSAPTTSLFSVVTYERDYATDKSGRRRTLYVEQGIDDPLIELMNAYAGIKS
jgi:hypothetical protein